jgi:hypothetical protein
MKKYIISLVLCLLAIAAEAQMFFGEHRSKQDSIFESLAATGRYRVIVPAIL